METVWGYKRLICQNCPEGSKNSKRKGVYKVYETNTHYMLQCVKCGIRTRIDKTIKGKQLQVKIK